MADLPIIPSGTPAPASTPPCLLLRPDEAAASLRIGRRQLAILTKRGDIRAVRIGRSVRYDPADLAAFVAGLKSGGKP